MSEHDSDKTKIKPVADDATRIAPVKKPMPSTTAEDKTRIAPGNRSRAGVISKTTEAQGGEDKTRIVSPGRTNTSQAGSQPVEDITAPLGKQSFQDDKTRVFSGEKQAPTPADNNDVTRFNPNVVPDEDKTRVTPSEHLHALSNSEDSSLTKGKKLASSVNIGEHGILKDRFVLDSVIGAGGMGVVYKAKDLLKVEAQDRDPYVAIKVLSEEFKAHPEAFISLQRESRKSQRIAHPNIVNVYDFDRDGDTVFMTMEFMDGQPLDQLIRQYKSTGLPTDDAWTIIKGMSAALSHAHAEHIIHSDFKPGNVFVTKRGQAKVFDFGIARAVAKVEHVDDDPEDKTIFDAGNLGALTPAYASLEMLEGEEPDVRDDIYALGCVAYELFTGVHPYNKVPANEAEKLKLKPKRITNIKKHEWRAIEKAIAFRREDRLPSVDKFIESISPKLKATNKLATFFALLLSVVITAYFLFFQEKPVDPYSEFDIRSELELKIKIDFYKDELKTLINNPVFTDPWENSIWRDISDLLVLTKGEDKWVDEQRTRIYYLYVSQIDKAIKNYKYSKAKHLIENAKRFTDDTTELEGKIQAIETALRLNRMQKDEQAKREQAARLKKYKTSQLHEEKKVKRQEDIKLFEIALDNVNSQLKCQGRLNMRNFETAIKKLRELDNERYLALKDNMVNSLASCITQTGKTFPERALEAKKHSLRIFKSNKVLSGIVIKSRDPCDISLAGLGSRGQRAVCKDKLKDAGKGPVLVVIPGNRKLKPFAIGKYEVSIKELNKYCKVSPACKPVKGKDESLPAVNLSIKVIKSYLKWLSVNSSQKYRLPTKNEWLYAAKSRRKKIDANRNCKLSTRGIQKGGKLISTVIGKQNSWGLVNYVGNVQELVFDKGRKLIAIGGSFKKDMDQCDIKTIVPHRGIADEETGFRVLRELR